MNLFAKHLRKMRMEKGLMSKEMAYALKIKPYAYSRIENGQTEVKLEMAHKIAKIVQKPIEDVFDLPNKNYEITNGDNSLTANNNTILNLQNQKLVDAVLKLSEQISNTNEQQVLIMQNQNEILRELVKIKKVL